MMKLKKLAAAVATATAIGISGTPQAAQNTVLGDLAAQGPVKVTSLGASFSVANTSYSLLGGDVVKTGSKSQTTIFLEQSGTLLLAADTELSVEKVSDVFEIELVSGAVQFSFDKGAPFRITAGEKTVTSSDNEFIKVSETQIRGTVAFKDGQFYVNADSAALVVSSADGQFQNILAGESFAANVQESELVKVQTFGGVTFGSAEFWAIVAAIIAAGFAINEATSDDDDDDPVPAPVPDPVVPPAPAPAPAPVAGPVPAPAPFVPPVMPPPTSPTS